MDERQADAEGGDGARGGHRRQLMVQIDGRSRGRLDGAIERGMAPALARLVRGGGHRLVSMYSGLPSTTPAVQGELFYGVRCVVPSFAFLDGDGRARHMLEPEWARRMEGVLRSRCDGGELLGAGSSYCNVYTGGAVAARFCPAGIGGVESDAGAGRHGERVRGGAAIVGLGVRSGVMMCGEVVRQARDMVRGEVGARGVRARMRDAWNRILVSVAMRDVSRAGAIGDLRRGLPVVHVNFLGYDKQAHRYGPDSAPAMRALKGIDGAIGSMVEAAEECWGDGGTVVVYSDHGQEATEPIARVAGSSIGEIVAGCARAIGVRGGSDGDGSGSGDGGDAGEGVRRSLAERVGERVLGVGASDDAAGIVEGLSVVESGPIAHAYFEGGVERGALEDVAQRVSEAARSVLVIARGRDGDGDGDGGGWARAFVGGGAAMEIAQVGEVLEGDYPFGDRIAADLERVCGNEMCGDLVMIGTGFVDAGRAGGRAVTFAEERGSHGGAGGEETHAFAIVPCGGAGGSAFDGVEGGRFEDLRRALLADRRGAAR
ncbi:MAG: alkaline phosphatase family protein [Phycisphaerales bacterium]